MDRVVSEASQIASVSHPSSFRPSVIVLSVYVVFLHVSHLSVFTAVLSPSPRWLLQNIRPLLVPLHNELAVICWASVDKTLR